MLNENKFCLFFLINSYQFVIPFVRPLCDSEKNKNVHLL